MRIVFLGGTRFVGPAAVAALQEAGHDVAIAHTGAHEVPGLVEIEHLHGSRSELLGGLIDRYRPEVLIDTFAGGATAQKGKQLREAAWRLDVAQIIAISSIDVYQHCVEAGMADGSGAVALARQPLPLTEEAPLRTAPYPGGSPAHDNIAMEATLHDVGRVTALRPGAIYGPHASVREWELVERVARGERLLKLPDGGTQIFHRVAVDRLARAIVGALEHAPGGFWACNVVDPYDWTYAGLAAQIGEQLGWEWEPQNVPFSETDHPWQTSHPIICSDRRLVDVLGVNEPDPAQALAETVDWLWETRDDPR